MNAEIIAGYLSGNITEEERALVDAWREKDDNETLFNECREVWELLAKDRESILPDTDLAWKKISESIKTPQLKKKETRSFYRLAAAACIMVPVLIYFLLFHKPAGEVVKPAQIAEHTTPAFTEIYTTDSLAQFYLPDSSRVLLNKGSRLTYPEKFGPDSRYACLTGEAFFEIKPDAARPFFVEAGESMIKVLGTSFNVNHRSGADVELTVVTGTVEFSTSTIPGKPKLVIVEGRKANLKNREVSTGKHDKSQKEWWQERKKNRFKRFLGKIKKIFRKTS